MFTRVFYTQMATTAEMDEMDATAGTVLKEGTGEMGDRGGMAKMAEVSPIVVS